MSDPLRRGFPENRSFTTNEEGEKQIETLFCAVNLDTESILREICGTCRTLDSLNDLEECERDEDPTLLIDRPRPLPTSSSSVPSYG